MFKDFNHNMNKWLNKGNENINKQLKEIMKVFQDIKEKIEIRKSKLK